jgi:2-oxoisovalerate dehydrogenase E1 component
MATTLRLPVLFVVEDNDYAISVKGDLQTPGGNIAANLASFSNLHIWDGSGTIPEETASMVVEAVTAVRSGGGPGLLRLTVPRLSGHSSVDNQAYKSEDEQAAEWKRDPLVALKEFLVPGRMPASVWDALVEEAERTVTEARQAALALPFPDPKTVGHHVFFDWATVFERLKE